MKKVDCVIKLGGSLLYNPTSLKKLLDFFCENNKDNIVFTIGSGYLGEAYKGFLSGIFPGDIPFKNSVMNYANIQSINGNVLVGLNPNFVVCQSEEEIYSALEMGLKPIADARGFISCFEDDPFQKSDVRSANICSYLKCKNLIIITCVSGIYDDDPNKNPEAHIISEVSPEILEKMGRTAVDEGLAQKISELGINCWVLGIDNLIGNRGIIDETAISTGTSIRR